MTVDHLHRFLVHVQKQENATVEDAQAIMHSTAHIFHRKGFNLETFFKYLFGDSNPAIDVDRKVIGCVCSFVCYQLMVITYKVKPRSSRNWKCDMTSLLVFTKFPELVKQLMIEIVKIVEYWFYFRGLEMVIIKGVNVPSLELGSFKL